MRKGQLRIRVDLSSTVKKISDEKPGIYFVWPQLTMKLRLKSFSFAAQNSLELEPLLYFETHFHLRI